MIVRVIKNIEENLRKKIFPQKLSSVCLRVDRTANGYEIVSSPFVENINDQRSFMEIEKIFLKEGYNVLLRVNANSIYFIKKIESGD